MTDVETLDLCGVLGIPVKSHSSSLNEAYADMVRRRAARDGLARTEAPVEPDWPDQAEVSRVRGELRSSAAEQRKPNSSQPRPVPPPTRSASNARDSRGSAARASEPVGDEPFQDPFDRAEMLFPYPVAALVRSTRVSDEPPVLRDAYLKLGEALARAYGLVAVSSSGLSIVEVFGKGAISAGGWLAATRRAAEISVSLPAGYSWAETKGHAGWHLAQLVSLRNRSHHKHGVDSVSQVNALVRQAREHVEAVLKGSGWLCNSRWVGVSRCEYTHEGHVVRARVLRGSDAQWIHQSIPVATPAVPGSVLAIDAETEQSVDMSRLARMVECESCGREELFTLDAVGVTSTFVCIAGHTLKVQLD